MTDDNRAQQHGKLLATEPPQGVLGTRHRPQALCHRDQPHVARLMAAGGIKQAETVRIDALLLGPMA